MPLTFTGDVSENEIRKMFRARTHEGSMIVVSLSQEAIQKFGEKSAIQKSCDKFSAGLLDGGGNISVTTDDFSKQKT